MCYHMKWQFNAGHMQLCVTRIGQKKKKKKQIRDIHAGIRLLPPQVVTACDSVTVNLPLESKLRDHSGVML